VVYQDADTLDRILRAKWRSMSQSRATSSKRYVVVWVFQQAVGCVCVIQQAVCLCSRHVYKYSLGIFCTLKIQSQNISRLVLRFVCFPVQNMPSSGFLVVHV